MRKRYVLRNGELVEKQFAPPSSQMLAMSDAKEFVTQDGHVISGRAALRAYEQKHGVRQIGNDWQGSKPPAFWDMHMARQRGSREEPR